MLLVSFERPETNEVQNSWRFLFHKLPRQCPLLGNKIRISALFISKNTYFLCGKTAYNHLFKSIIGKSTPLMFSVVKIVHQCCFQCWRGAVRIELHRSLCPPQRMRCLQGERTSSSLHSPGSPSEILADSAELSWRFCARANNHSGFEWVQMTCSGRAVN